MKRWRNQGVTLVELLIAMGVFGILLAVTSAVMISTGRVAARQERLADTAGDARLALFRIGEVVRQAGYIYPPGVDVTVSGAGTFTTGAGALILLVPAGTTYCTGVNETYCGFVYAVTNRTQFVPPLPASGSTSQALMEVRVEGLEWPKDIVPALELISWPAGSSGLIADGVDTAATNLGGNVSVSAHDAIYDDSSRFRIDPANLEARTLVNGATASVRLLSQATGGNVASEQQLELFTRAVPRSTPPNLQ